MSSLLLSAIAGISLLLSSLAFWRSGRYRRMLAEDIASRLREGYADFVRRLNYAKILLADARLDASPEARARIDRISEELDELAPQAQRELERLQFEISRGVHTRLESLLQQMQRLESRVRLVELEAEIIRAQRLADRREFAAAEDLLANVLAEVQDVRATFRDSQPGEAAFSEIIASLQHAMRSVQSRAKNSRNTLDDVLRKSDSLLGSLDHGR